MRRLTLRSLSLFAASVVTASSAWAACSLSDVAGKTWMVSATEITSNTLFFCKMTVTGSATVTSLNNGCSDFPVGDTNFNSPTRYDVKSGSIKLISTSDCIYEATLKLGNGSNVAIGRFVLDSGKSVGVGNFMVSWGGGGSFNLVKTQ